MNKSFFAYLLIFLCLLTKTGGVVAQQTPLLFPEKPFTRVHYYKQRAGFEQPKAENGILLSPTEIQKLMKIVYDTASYIEPVFRCYDPNDLFVFYNDKNRVVGRIEVAFKCKKISPDPAMPLVQKIGNGLTTPAIDTLELLLNGFAQRLKTEAPEGSIQVSHVVTEGERWETIAKQYNTSVDLIAAINKKNTQWTPSPGDELIIYQNFMYFKYPELNKNYMNGDFTALITPKATTKPLETPTNIEEKPEVTSSQSKTEPKEIDATLVNEVFHVVKSNETLYAISRVYGVSVDAIKKANEMKDNTIKLGQKLKIPKI